MPYFKEVEVAQGQMVQQQSLMQMLMLTVLVVVVNRAAELVARLGLLLLSPLPL
jgi:hypothetical protein